MAAALTLTLSLDKERDRKWTRKRKTKTRKLENDKYEPSEIRLLMGQDTGRRRDSLCAVMLRFARGARLFQLWNCGFEALLVCQRTEERVLL